MRFSSRTVKNETASDKNYAAKESVVTVKGTMKSGRDREPRIYVFGWPSNLGGADTRLVHLLLLLSKSFQITVIPNDEYKILEGSWSGWMRSLGISVVPHRLLPGKLKGCALSLSNEAFFSMRIAHLAKERGLRVIWSSEMMWHHAGELEAIKEGVVDHVLYVAEIQKTALSTEYQGIPASTIGNYIEPSWFPFKMRKDSVKAVGRLSRAAVEKYPENFPVFYEALGLENVRFRVMAWSSELADNFHWHQFDKRWEFLEAEHETQVQFLHSIDLFIYPLGNSFIESWGRSTAEAMLTGCVPIVPTGHNLTSLIDQGRSGFYCDKVSDWRECVKRLCEDHSLRRRMSMTARQHIIEIACDYRQHLTLWSELFERVIAG